MSIVRLVELVDKNLGVSPKFFNLQNFYSLNEEPLLEYYTFDIHRSRLDSDSLVHFIIGGYSAEDILIENGPSSLKYSYLVEKDIFCNLNKRLEEEVSDYKHLRDLIQKSNYAEKYLQMEEAFERIAENVFEADIEIFYSSDVYEAISQLEGKALENADKFNDYLIKLYSNK